MPRSYSPSSTEAAFVLSQLSQQAQAQAQLPPPPPPFGSISNQYNGQTSFSDQRDPLNCSNQHHNLDISFDSSYEFGNQLEPGQQTLINSVRSSVDQTNNPQQQTPPTTTFNTTNQQQSQHQNQYHQQQRQQQFQSTRYPTSDDLESESSNDSRNHDLDTKWSWKSLKREFKLSHSESLFHLYQAKLQHSFFVALLILNIIFYSGSIFSHSLSHFLVDRC